MMDIVHPMRRTKDPEFEPLAEFEFEEEGGEDRRDDSNYAQAEDPDPQVGDPGYSQSRHSSRRSRRGQQFPHGRFGRQTQCARAGVCPSTQAQSANPYTAREQWGGEGGAAEGHPGRTGTSVSLITSDGTLDHHS